MIWKGVDTYLIIQPIILYVILIYLYFSERYKINKKTEYLFIILVVVTCLFTFTTAVYNLFKLLEFKKTNNILLYRIRITFAALFSFLTGIILLVFMGSNRYNKTLFSF